MIYGAIVAWIALLIIAKVPVPGLGTVWPAIEIGSRPDLYSFAKGLHASDVTLQPIGPDGQLRILYLALFQLREQFMRAPAHDAHVLAMHPTACADAVHLAHLDEQYFPWWPQSTLAST